MRQASHRSPAAHATSEHTSYESRDAELTRSGSAATRDAAPRYPALDLDEQAQQQLSRQVEQPRLRVGATDEDTEASCLCGPGSEASVPAPAPSKFNPVPIVATAASVPVLAKWYTTNPATNGQAATDGVNTPSEAVNVPVSAPTTSPQPSNDNSTPVEAVAAADKVEDVSKPSEEVVGAVAESPATGEMQAEEPAADQGSNTVTITPKPSDEGSAPSNEETVVIEAPVAQSNESKDQVSAIEQPAVEPLSLVPNPEESGQLVSDTLLQAPPLSMTVSNSTVANPSLNLATMQPLAMKVMPVSITQGNKVQVRTPLPGIRPQCV